MRQVAFFLSRLLAIASACTGLIGVTMAGHSLLTPQSRLPRLHDEGPSVLMRFGIGAVCAAILLGLLGYALARIGSAER
jgi:hypothetical protein